MTHSTSVEIREAEQPTMRWKAAARLIIALLSFYVFGALVAAAIPSAIAHLGLVPDRVRTGSALHSLVTYPLVHSGIGHALQVGGITALLVALVVKWIPEREILLLMGLSSLFGGAIFVLMYSQSAVLIGAAMANWGLAGAVVGSWVRNRSACGWAEHAYGVTIALIIVVTGVLGSEYERILVLTGVFGLFWIAFRARRFARASRSRV